TSFSDNYYGQLTAVSPKGAGTVDVTVTTANGTSAISPADQFTYTPTVLAISPATGPAAGGTGVVITGLGLTGAQAVSFGPKAATGISVNSVTGQVTATSPTGAGTVDVQVTTPDGTSPTSAADQFTYQNSTITSIVVTAPAAATIGVAFNVTITAENSAGQAVSGYTGPVGLFASDGQAVSPAAVPLTNGTATVPVTLYIPDTLTLIGVVGSPSGNLSGSSGSIVVSPVGIKVVVANGTLTAGVPFGVMLTAVDAAGNTCTGDQGYVTLGTGGPTIYGLQNPSVKLVNGTASPTISLHAAGSFTLSALQGTAPGNTGIVVAAATPTALAVAIGPAGSPLSSVNAGTGFTLTVSATDTYGNQACASDILRGTVSVSCSDHQAVTITSFTNYQSQDVPITATVTLDKPDSSVTLKVTSKTKKVNGQTLGLNLKASTAPFAVVLGPPAKFIVSAPASETVGVPFKIKVTAEDAGSNVITSYNQALSFSTTPTQPVTAGATTWSKGVGTTMITLNAAGTPTLTATAGSGASQITGTSGSITVGGDWFSSNVPDPGLQTLARADYVANGGTIRSKSPGDTGGSLTYNNWLGLFTQAETAGTVNSNVLTSLQNLANNAKFLKLSDSVANLAHKVVFSDPANGYYHPLDSNGIAQNQPLGNLQAGDSATKLQDLVNKWFLGMDYPSSEYGNRPSSSTPAYQLVNAPGAANPVPLWGPGESASHVFYFDVQQMYLADCWILAPLAAVAIQDPGAVYSMITYNGNGTYSVRFYNNKVADYVTVDTELPDGGSNCFDNISHVDPGADFSEFVNATGPVAIPTNPTFGQPYNSSELWVALVEKAYAQENGEGWLPSNNPGSDGYGTPGGIGYQAINWSDTEDLWGTDHVIAAYTGKSASGSLTITPSTLGKDFQKGEPAILGTLPEDKTIQTGVHIVERHVYAVIGYYSKSGTFTLFNPWGINGSYYTPDGETSSVFCSGILTPSSSQVQTDFRMEVNGGSVAAGLSHALANVSSTSVAASPSGGSLAAPGAAQRAALGQWSQPATPLAAAHPVVNRLAALDAALASGVAEGQHKLALDGDKLSKDRIDALLGANDLPLAASLNP
ncbi:MAG: C2 family cysteine protease, partial [Thermoguttaceae bacterium]